MPLQWCRCDYNEYPPVNLLVWTTDCGTVRKGVWTFPGPGVPLDEGSWKDEAGEPIAVTEWLPIEESPGSPPPPPPWRPRSNGGIAGFRLTDEDQ